MGFWNYEGGGEFRTYDPLALQARATTALGQGLDASSPGWRRTPKAYGQLEAVVQALLRHLQSQA